MILQHPAFCFWHDYITSPVTQHWPNSRQPPCPLSLRFDLVRGWVIKSQINNISLHIYCTLQHILSSFPIFSYGIKVASLFPTLVLLRNAQSTFLALTLFSISKKILCFYTGARWQSWKCSHHTLPANLSIAPVDSLKAILGPPPQLSRQQSSTTKHSTYSSDNTRVWLSVWQKEGHSPRQFFCHTLTASHHLLFPAMPFLAFDAAMVSCP